MGCLKTSKVERLNSGTSSRNAVMGERYLAGRRVAAAAEEACVGDGVVRRAEGAQVQERTFAGEEAADAVDLGNFDGCLEIHGRHDGRDALGEHVLAASRRANHEDVMPSGAGDFDGSLGGELTADICEVDFVLWERLFREGRAGGLKLFIALKKLEGLPEDAHPIGGDAAANKEEVGKTMRIVALGCFQPCPAGLKKEREQMKSCLEVR